MHKINWHWLKWSNQSSKIVLFLVVLGCLFNLTCYGIAEGLWFFQIGYLESFLTRLGAQGLIGLGVAGLTGSFWGANLVLARRLRHNSSNPSQPLIPLRLKLGRLLLGFVSLSLLLGFLLWHYGTIALQAWQPGQIYSLPPIPPPFTLQQIGDLLGAGLVQRWSLFLFLAFPAAIGVGAEWLLPALAVIYSISTGWTFAHQWERILPIFAATAFNLTEPLFQQDIRFYIFYLPVWELVQFWLVILVLFALLVVSLTYLLSGDSLSQGYFPGLSQAQYRHLYALTGLLALVAAQGFWLLRYGLLYSQQGVVYGASYTETHVQLPLLTFLSGLSLAIAGLLGWRAIRGLPQLGRKRLRKLRIMLSLYGIVVSLIYLIPDLVQNYFVLPNELAQERPYLERTISLTRRAFDLDTIQVDNFDPIGNLDVQDLQRNLTTLRNIRLWDTQPLLQANRQLQQIRLYYDFPSAEIDRYTINATAIQDPWADFGQSAKPNDIPSQSFSAAQINQQVIIAPRELDYNTLPDAAKTWVNRHLVYTHGYGFTVSPVNRAAADGLPEYFVKDIGSNINSKSQQLRISHPALHTVFPTDNPRLYYGKLTTNYVLTNTDVQEFDYPREEGNEYTTYAGDGGVPLGSFWRRLCFTIYMRDWRILLNRNLTSQTRILLWRDIQQRVRLIAPFLRYDSQPYLVVAKNPAAAQHSVPSYLYWIIDAYTSSDRYPYSDPGTNTFNYIRNSVKIVLNAYHGDVSFYVANPQDPIVTTWQKIFPNLFKPLDEMPEALRSHIRYPVDLFSLQSERFLNYHMTDPVVFYNREDQWQIPLEIYGQQPRPVKPYYLNMRLPTENQAEFILLSPFTPSGRNNLIAWLAARSDGDQYGKLLLYQFPKQRLIFGPEQLEARINQVPDISQQISLWNRRGSKVSQGNLLVIPIESSLLYVEPLYLEADFNSIPMLARVIASYRDRIVMQETLRKCLEAMFLNPTPQSVPTVTGSPQP